MHKYTLIICTFFLVLFQSFQSFAQSDVSICLLGPNSFGGLGCNPISSANPLPITGTVENRGANAYSGFSLGTTPVQVLAANPTRAFLDIVNQSASVQITCSFGATTPSPNGAGSITIASLGRYRWDSNFIPTDSVNCRASTASTPITVGEF